VKNSGEFTLAFHAEISQMALLLVLNQILMLFIAVFAGSPETHMTLNGQMA
jgi:hypothetical protein